TGQGGNGIGSQSSGNDGVGISGNVTATGTGNISIVGTGGTAPGGYGVGVALFGIEVMKSVTPSVVSSNGGNIQVFGTGGAAGPENSGVSIFSDGLIKAGGTGTVNVQGTGGASSDNNNYGVQLDPPGPEPSSSAGTVTSSGGNVTV